MILDYVPSTRFYTLRVPRASGVDPKRIMREHGLDFSEPASTVDNAVLFTAEPYAAASFADYCTPMARSMLDPLLLKIEASRAQDSDAHIACPADQELWPFQKASISYALSRRNTLIGDQPGLGKTPIAICFANEIRAKRVLVICPANIRLQWVDRIRQWTTMTWPFTIYPILSSRHGVHPTAEWTVVSYDLARTEAIGRALARGKYDLVVLDEAHYLKSIESARTRAMFGDHTGLYRKQVRDEDKKVIGYEDLFKPLAGNCGAILGLTGTPLPNRPREAYTLAKHLCFDSIDWMSEDSFSQRFNPIERRRGVNRNGEEYTYTREEVGRAGELQNRLRANFMVRHLKRDVMKQLKMPAFNIVRVEETRAIRDVLEAESMLGIDPDALESGTVKVDGHIAVVRKMMGVAIAPLVADYAAMCLDGGEDKVTIFAWHIDVLNILEERLRKFGVQRIDGSTTAPKRAERINNFMNDPTARVMLGNTLALGVGVDGLQTVCNHALLAEPEWVPGNNEQAIDRLDRGGQRERVQADLFTAPGSLLERILVSALRKRQNTHKALDELY